ncbi:DUF5999 family protein (plasmid) [Streptomyces sp. NBC_00161]
MCQHKPLCPPAEAADREAAKPVANYPEQGWSLLCNGVVLFDDSGELLPNGRIVAPHRPLIRTGAAACEELVAATSSSRGVHPAARLP